MSPAEKGTCSNSYQRYAYNVNMAKCLVFEYSGCEGELRITISNVSEFAFLKNSFLKGNLNNFEKIEQCESTCDILIQMSQQGVGK